MISGMRPSSAGALAIVLLAGCQPAASSSASPAFSTAPSAGATTSPTATPVSPPPPQIAWSDEPFEGAVHAVAVDGAQFVAVGATVDGPTAWTSLDGVAWEKHAVPQPAVLEEYREGVPGGDLKSYLNLPNMGPLARLGDTLFSFGTFAGDNDFFRPLGWRSADGAAWDSIESENPFFDQCCSIVQIAAGDQGLLAVKHNFAGLSGELWLWTASTSWALTWPTKPPESENLKGAEILDAVWADGKYVAVGMAATYEADNTPEWRTTASSWVSTDGHAWQAAPDSGDLAGSVMESVSALPGGGFVAVGCDRCQAGDFGTPVAWVSADGLGWTGSALPSNVEGTAYRVLQVGGILLAIGAAQGKTLTWTSADGIGWAAGPMLGAASGGRFPSFVGQHHNATARDDEVLFFLYLGPDDSGVVANSVLMRGVVEN
jgi:hypothetical protein